MAGYHEMRLPKVNRIETRHPIPDPFWVLVSTINAPFARAIGLFVVSPFMGVEFKGALSMGRFPDR
jgi:hypothetical protein